MKAKQLVPAIGLFCLSFLAAVCDGGEAQAKIVKAAKEHAEQITAAQYTYQVKMGGTLDGFNSAEYLQTYGGSMRQLSKFEPNKFLVLENIGDTSVINPRIVINGRRNWFTADDILASILKPGMTDEQKAKALYAFLGSPEVQAHDNNRRPGPSYPDPESNPSKNTFKERANPVKAVNCYYCGGCQFESSNYVILARHAGLVARAVWMSNLNSYSKHCVAEVWYDGDWHMYDADQRTYLLDSDNTTIASYKTIHEKPDVAGRTNDRGFAATFDDPKPPKNYAQYYAENYPPHVMPVEQWLSTMDMTLRPGEKFVWRWDNTGKYHSGNNNRDQGKTPHNLANGKMIYQPKIAGTAFLRDAVAGITIKSVGTDEQTAKLQPEVAGSPGIAIYKIATPYPIVGAIVGAKFFRKTDADSCKIFLSAQDSDWIEVWSADNTSADKTGEIKPLVSLDAAMKPKETNAVYDYYVKFEIKAKDNPEDVALSEINFESDVQISAMAIPALSVGNNEVVYTDKCKNGRKVRITHAWQESSETKPPIAPAKAVIPSDGAEVNIDDFKKMTWEAAIDPDGKIADYHIQVSMHPDMLIPLCNNFDRIIHSAQPNWDVPQGFFVKGRTYYWRVRTQDDWGAWSGWSNIWKFAVK